MKYLFQFILVSIAVYLFSTLFIYYIELRDVDYQLPYHEPVSAQNEKKKEIKPLEHFNRILERNLFSVVVDENITAQEEDLLNKIDNLDLTSLNCTLIGTIINEKGNSWAIIKDNQSGLQNKYTVGSTVSGARVVMIIRNKVVLNIDGRDELLVMGIEKIRAEHAKEQSNQVGSPGSDDIATFKISKDFVQQSINNISQIMSQVRVKPHLMEGKPSGFQVSRIKAGSLVHTMGFKDGDIIKGVNGHQIKSAEDIMKLYNMLKDSGFFSIEIERSNQPKTLNFKVR